jgi:lysophospholipase L1-like esterase
MAYTTIQVQGLVTLPTDEPAAGYRLKFELKRADKDSALVVPHQLYYTIPSDGNIDVALWPNARGIAGTVYYVYLIPPRTPDPNQPMGTLTVPDVAGPVNIWDHFDVAPPPTLSDAQAAELAAQGYAGQAAADRAAASDARTGAEVAQGLAEAARDAVTLIAASKGAYHDTTIAGAIALGVADLVEGDSFTAAGEDVEYIGLYVIETGPVAAEIARYPTVGAVDDVRATAIDSEAMRVLNGRGTNYGDASRMLEGYIRTDTGAFVANASYESCDFVAIDPEITLEVQFSQSLAATATANLIFYADDKTTILGIYNVAGAETEYIRPSSLYPTARYVIGTDYSHLIPPNGFTLRVHSRVEPGKVLGSEVDFFCEQTYQTYYDISNAAYRVSTSWLMTGLIPVYQGQTFVLTADTTGTGNFPTLIGLDMDGLYVAALRTTSATRATVTISNPAVAYVRAASRTLVTPSFVGGRIRHIAHPKVVMPAEIMGTVDEGTAVFARSILPDRNFPVAWNAESSTPRSFIPSRATTGVELYRLATVVDGGRAELDLGQTAFRFTTIPADPATDLNIICLGDSTTEGTGAMDGGTFRDWPNELSRQMTGVGTPAITGNTYYTPWGLTKVHFRGTMGLNTVKHEGRGGWSAEDYLTLADKTGRANAFWNPGTSDFDFGYYLTTNGFDIGSIASGVDATGSNCVVIIQLGWNDIREKGAVLAAADCATIIDKIKSARSATKFIILGLPPTPPMVRRNVLSTGGKIILPEVIMNEYILPHRREYSAIAAARSDVSYFDIAPTFDAETGFKMAAAQNVVPWSSDVTYTPANDYVHPGATGNMMMVPPLKAFIRYKFL